MTETRLVRERLGDRSIVMVGLMGCGKSAIGKRLATVLGLKFVDADAEIEAAAGMTIPEIFEMHGEPHFRDREQKVVQRLLMSPPQVLATGGGAFMAQATRDAIRAHGISIWLNADIEVLMRRVRRREDRPLLKTEDPRAVMQRLMEQRYPIYAEADLTVASADVSHERVVADVLAALSRFLDCDGPDRKASQPAELRWESAEATSATVGLAPTGGGPARGDTS
ncbi:MAG: shikimate kinase [Hyphomicrobiaceae bacterium]